MKNEVNTMIRNAWDFQESYYRCKMPIKCSKFNHGKSTIEENVASAIDLGLKFYGVSDHGPKHVLYGITNKNLIKFEWVCLDKFKI